MTLTLTMVSGICRTALKFTKTCLVFQDFKKWNKCWRKVILKVKLKLNFMSGHHQSRGTQRRYPQNALKTFFEAIQSTFRPLQMHSKRRYKICTCSVILENLSLFQIARASVLFSRKF